LSSGTFGIAPGPDGKLWFTEATANKVGYLVADSAIFGPEFVVTAGSQPRYITGGPDGNMWFTEFFGNRIGRVTPTGKIAEGPIPTSDSGPQGITTGPDGNVWFVESTGNKIARINLKKP
jgi:virginiamycin B lyase